MNRTPRQLSADRAILEALAQVPAGHLLLDSILRADVSRIVQPRPSTAELDEAIAHADTSRRIVGTPDDIGMLWELTAVGRSWRAQHR